MKMLYTDYFIIIIKWVFIFPIILNCGLCNMNYSFESGFGYVPFSPFKLNFNESEKLILLPTVGNNNKILLVLDTSENMYSQNRIHKLKHALHHWINSIPEDVMLGLAQFNDDAKPLIKISPASQTLKTEVLNAIPSIAEGGCCVGCAVKCALQMLGTDEKGGTIILITDGRNTVPGEDVKDILSIVSNTKVKINTIAVGDAADDLEQLAWTTGGRTYSVQDQQGLLMFSGALFDSLNNALGNILQFTNIFESEISNKDNKIHEDFVNDLALPMTTLSIYYGPEKDFDELILNSSESYMTSKNFEKWDKNRRYLAQTLQEGLWTISLSYNFLNKYAAVFVSGGLLNSEFKTKNKIRIMCWHSADAGPVNTTIKPVAIYASIFKEDHIVFDVNVSAILYAPNGSASEIDLWDNGSGADNVTNDYTYSRFLAIISRTGRYTLKFRVVGKYRAMTEGSVKSSSEVQPFSRICRTSSFKVISATNTFPPSAIRDLKIVERNKTFVTICWTAPGKHLDWGKVDKYIIKYMWMESCPRMLQINLSVRTTEVVAPISTHAAGETECLPLNYTDYLSLNTCLCLSVQATIEEGLTGPLSNIVKIYCPTINDTTRNSSLEDADEQSDKPKNETEIKIPKTSTNTVIAIIVPILIIACVGIIIFIWKRCRRNQTFNVHRANNNQRNSPPVNYIAVDNTD